VRVAPGTVVLSPPSLAALTDLTPVLLTFTNPTDQLKNIKAGIIVVGDKSAAAPSGFLRTVDKTFSTGHTLTLGTSQATLERAVPRAEAAISETLTAGEVARVRSALPGLRMAAGAGGTLAFDLGMITNDDDPTTEAGVRGEVRGDISVVPKVDFDFSIGVFSSPYFRFTGTAEIRASLQGSIASYVKSTLVDEELAKVEFTCQTYFVGLVPIVVCRSSPSRPP
jgi:hypothetical protein